MLNKVAVGRDFSIEKDIENIDLAYTVMKLVTSNIDSVQVAQDIISSVNKIPRFVCSDGEIKTVKTYGVNDLFSTAK